MLSVASRRLNFTNVVRINQFKSIPFISRPLSTITHYPASKTAEREVPTPLIFVSASTWEQQSPANKTFKSFTQYCTSQGWNCYCIDIDAYEGLHSIKEEKESSKILEKLELELKDQMQKLEGGGPFPPLLVSKGLSSLIAESYVSSNPLSGLALIDPPLDPAEAQLNNPELLPTNLEPFNYEPRFPCLVIWTQNRVKELKFYDIHRIERLQEDEADQALDRAVWDLQNEQEEEGAGPFQLCKWAEENGMVEIDDDDGIIEEESTLEEEEERPKSSLLNRPTILPQWYREGNYERNPTRTREPLLIDETHLTQRFIRGGGPGGQAINKTSSCVQLKHVPTGIIVRCQEDRSRELNRKRARRRMSRELERFLFGENDSVLGREALRAQQAKKKKQQKRLKKTREADNNLTID